MRAGQSNSKSVALKIAVFRSAPRLSREVELLSRNAIKPFSADL